jgi:uncharacterized protein (TIGR03437 family)
LNYNATGLSLQQQIGIVPAGTTQIAVTLSFSRAYAAADSLSLVLSSIGNTPASSVLGTNLVVNPGAEDGPNAQDPGVAQYVPGWSTAESLSVAPYGGTGWISATAPGPANRGVNLFCKPISGDTAMYQDIDVSAAATLIDAGQITYDISAWLGGLAGTSSPTLVYTFYDWAGNQLATTGTLGPVSHSGSALVETSHTGMLPPNTRRIHILLNFLAGTLDTMADNIAFALAAPSGPPVITPGGVVSASAFGGYATIAPGSWVEIYGTNLASSTAGWSGSDFHNGVAPTSLNGVTVSVGGTAAFIDYVSSGQINALVPSDAPIGSGAVAITVTNSNGASDPYFLYVKATQPGLLAPSNFKVSGKQYVAALLSDGQTFALPANAIPGVPSRPAMVGETVTIYGVGFGPVTDDFTAGTIVTQQNSLTTPVEFMFGSTAATLGYYGLAPAFTGLYQFNVEVPKVATNNAEPISIVLGGTPGSQTLYIAVQN